MAEREVFPQDQDCRSASSGLRCSFRNQQQTSRTPIPVQQSLPAVSSDGRAVRASMHSPGAASQRRDSDSPSGRDASVATSCSNLTYLNVFTVEEYESNGKTGKRWTKINISWRLRRRAAKQRPSTTIPLIDAEPAYVLVDADDARRGKSLAKFPASSFRRLMEWQAAPA